jgi:acyl carrier protein
MTAGGAQVPASGAAAAGRAELLATVLQVTGEVFGRPVTAADRFFDLGGDSVTAIDLAVRFEERFGIDLDIDELFEAGEIAGFADVLASRIAASHDHDT